MSLNPKDVGMPLAVAFRCQACGKHNSLPAIKNINEADGKTLTCSGCGTFYQVDDGAVFLSPEEAVEVTPLTTFLQHGLADEWLDVLYAFNDADWAVLSVDGRRITIGTPPDDDSGE